MLSRLRNLDFLSLLSVGVSFLLYPALSGAAPSCFNLYAYGGDTIGGVPIVYLHGYAYIAINSDSDDFTSIYFTPTSQQPASTWQAHPNTTISPDASFDTVTLAIPTSGQGPVALISGSPSSGQTVPNMFLYGQTAAVYNSGQLEMLFYAVTTPAAGVWELQWDVANPNDANVIAVAVRAAPPSNPSNRPNPPKSTN